MDESLNMADLSMKTPCFMDGSQIFTFNSLYCRAERSEASLWGDPSLTLRMTLGLGLAAGKLPLLWSEE